MTIGFTTPQRTVKPQPRAKAQRIGPVIVRRITRREFERTQEVSIEEFDRQRTKKRTKTDR